MNPIIKYKITLKKDGLSISFTKEFDTLYVPSLNESIFIFTDWESDPKVLSTTVLTKRFIIESNYIVINLSDILFSSDSLLKSASLYLLEKNWKIIESIGIDMPIELDIPEVVIPTENLNKNNNNLVNEEKLEEKKELKNIDIISLKKDTIFRIVNIFETGSPTGDYSNVTYMEGDSGGLSYGRSQVTLNSGTLYDLLVEYIEEKKEEDPKEDPYKKSLDLNIIPIINKFKLKDPSLNKDKIVKDTLVFLGKDETMHFIQDSFFEERYWNPAYNKAKSLGLIFPLSYAIVYDSFIQGSFSTVRKEFPEYPPEKNGDEKKWSVAYVNAREKWLGSKSFPLKDTVYRMHEFKKIIEQDNWNLDLPIKIRGWIIG